LLGTQSLLGQDLAQLGKPPLRIRDLKQMKYAELWHIPLRDAREAADLRGHRRCPDLAAFFDQAHAERAVFADAHLGHIEVALFEYLERQHATGKQHGVQGKYVDILVRIGWHVSVASGT